MDNQKNISFYWKCQVLGWSLASLFWNLNAFLDGGFYFGIALIHFFLDVLIGITITHLYRQFATRQGWLGLNLRQLLGRLIAAIAMTGLIYTGLILVKNYGVQSFFAGSSPFIAFVWHHFLPLLATGIRLLAIWILAFHLYHYAFWQIKTSEENARLQVIAKEAELNNLSSQLNPHFFFNSINTIKALVASDPDKARRAIDLLAELLRTALYRRDHRLIPLAEEMALVSDYLELEKIRFAHKLAYTIQVDQQLGNGWWLPLSIQTLVENAVKHGIATRTGSGMVHIKVEKLGNRLQVTVQNPGRLEQADPARGLGLKNLSDRLNLHYAGQASLRLYQRSEAIISAVLIIPYDETD